MASPKFASVDEYIAALPEAARPVLERVRAIIRRALPRAEESISYNMPTYKLGAVAVIYFAGWKRHYSLYPVNEQVASACGVDLERYSLEKGTLRLPLDEPVPAKLIASISKLLATRDAPKASTSALRPTSAAKASAAPRTRSRAAR
ncbi:MAG: DUF1801 domain-containing protein [Myxococcales bacterium]